MTLRNYARGKYALALLVAAAAIPLAGTIDIDNLENYANQSIPTYISKDNTSTNPITDAGATLGRVLFYDVNLSSNNTVSCATCHRQNQGFGHRARASTGVNGDTGRHSPRLVNSRFADEVRFFWDERAGSLEQQTTMPIQDHAEMGFSGTMGDPTFLDLLDKLDDISYYNDLFYLAFGDTVITELRMQKALAQFVRSIQSFDTKYDLGRVQVASDGDPFPNFTVDENLGKDLFLSTPTFELDTLTVVTSGGTTVLDSVAYRISGGLGCDQCHRAPEFDIDPASLNNSLTETIAGLGQDDTNTRSPSLRDLYDNFGLIHAPVFHAGMGSDISTITDHYNLIRDIDTKTNIDPRLLPMGKAQFLNMQPSEIVQLEAFLKTLTGSDVYSNTKWSNPFDGFGNLSLKGDLGLVRVKVKVLLSGAWSGSEMRTDLIQSGDLPLNSPYTEAPAASVLPSFFTNHPEIVDWIWVELRSSLAASSMVARQAAFVDKDGNLIDLNGSQDLVFNGLNTGSYYVVVGHRNHLSSISAVAKNLTSSTSTRVDFRTAGAAYGINPQRDLGSGLTALWSGDGNNDKTTTAFDFIDVWLDENGSDGYLQGDFNLDGRVTAFDFIDGWLPANGRTSQVPN